MDLRDHVCDILKTLPRNRLRKALRDAYPAPLLLSAQFGASGELDPAAVRIALDEFARSGLIPLDQSRWPFVRLELGRCKDLSALTLGEESCDQMPIMADSHLDPANKKNKSPGNAIDENSRLPQGIDRELERLRQRLKTASNVIAHLDPKQAEHIELLNATTELTMVFSDFVDQWLRARIVPIESSFNEQLKSRASATLPEKQELSKWANAELRDRGLAIRCPKTRRPSILLAEPGNHPEFGRFRLQHKGLDGKWKRPLATPSLLQFRLMPALPSLDVDLASVLSRLVVSESSNAIVA